MGSHVNKAEPRARNRDLLGGRFQTTIGHKDMVPGDSANYILQMTVKSDDFCIGSYSLETPFRVEMPTVGSSLPIAPQPKRDTCAIDNLFSPPTAMRCPWDSYTSDSRYGRVEYIEANNGRRLRSVQQVDPTSPLHCSITEFALFFSAWCLPTTSSKRPAVGNKNFRTCLSLRARVLATL